LRIHVNLDNLAILLDLPEGMTIESASSDDLTLFCEVTAPSFEDGTYFAEYGIDADGNVSLVDLRPIE
jgi:hypothetical protein